MQGRLSWTSHHCSTTSFWQRSFLSLLPPQLHLILATRADPPLPITLLRARGHLLEVRTDELRCNPDEATAFLEKSVSIQLSQDMIEAVTTRTEGWLVGLQLLSLSLQRHVDPGD